MSTTQDIDDNQTIGPSGNLCDTEIKVHELNYFWTFSDYDYCKRTHSRGQFTQSPNFSAATNDDCIWYLKCYPNGSTSSENNNCSLYLQLHSSSKCKTVYGEFKFSILNENKTTMN